MKKLIEKLEIKKHPWMYTALFASMILGIIPIVLCIIISIIGNTEELFKLSSLVSLLYFLIPCFLVAITNFIGMKKFDKHPEIVKWVTATLNIFYLVILLLTITVALLLYILVSSLHSIKENSTSAETNKSETVSSVEYTGGDFYNDPEDYQKAMNRIGLQSTYTQHFPKEIPSNAKNIEFCKVTLSFPFQPYEAVELKFTIDDKNYINNELKKYKPINTFEGATTRTTDCRTFDKEGYNDKFKDLSKEEQFKIYVLEENNTPGERRYKHGIAVNKKGDTIFYYTENPDLYNPKPTDNDDES